MKNKFMVKYLCVLLIISLTGCYSEPQFPNPIEPTENKTETIKNWMNDFDLYIVYSPVFESDIHNIFYGLHMPFNFYGPIMPYFLQAQKQVCAPRSGNYPRSVINHKSSTKKSVLVFYDNFHYDRYGLKENEQIIIEASNEIKEQCHKSHDTIKNQYLSFIQDGIIDENEYKQLNNIYLEERNKVINTIKTMNKLAREDALKEEMQEIQKKKLEEDNNKNGVGVIK